MGRPRAEVIEALSLEVRRAQNRSDAYDDAVAEALRVNRTDLRCIDVLSQESGSITAGRLAGLMGLSTGAMTTVLDRLERAGYARRVRDEHDRRRVQVELTRKAHEDVWSFYAPLAALADELYARYTDEQLELLLGFLEQGRALAERVDAELRERLARAAG